MVMGLGLRLRRYPAFCAAGLGLPMPKILRLQDCCQIAMLNSLRDA